MNDADIGRIYAEGYRPDDFREQLNASLVIVRPLRPPEKIGAIITTIATNNIKGTECLLYEVVRGDADNTVNKGDVVILRNAMLDPLHPNLETLAVDRKHILERLHKGEG